MDAILAPPVICTPTECRKSKLYEFGVEVDVAETETVAGGDDWWMEVLKAVEVETDIVAASVAAAVVAIVAADSPAMDSTGIEVGRKVATVCVFDE